MRKIIFAILILMNANSLMSLAVIVPKIKDIKQKSNKSNVGKEIDENKFDKSMPNSLFETIKIDPKKAAEIIDVWAHQAEEHIFFLLVGLVDSSVDKNTSNLKTRAKKLHAKLEAFKKKFKADKSLKVMNQLLPLLKESRSLLSDVAEKLKAKEWIGWLYPSEIDHMIMEQDYVVNKLNDPNFSTNDEKKFCKKESLDHLAVMRNRLDPDPAQKQWVDKANDILNKHLNVPEEKEAEFIDNALQAVKEVNEYAKEYDANKDNIKSIISDKLANHEAREGKYCEKILQEEHGNKTQLK